ncbi:TIGR04255 family protein [Candidatus Thiosymbion oneisti]|uniref:TIGR04255 family protein n=1 Tax=Candidatus Thiosymbion oneisti TaxID=589554 RepID=UPI000B7F3756|nr:TIGR04255 family protein [Candidatus Thiosymbion oneisti]
MVTVVPIADRHAIKTVSFALEWRDPLQEDILTLLMALHPRVRDKLPRVLKQEEILFNVVVGPVEPERQAPAKPRLAGVMFDALQPNGQQAWALVVRKNFLVVSCHIYTRWNDIWREALELLTPFVPILAKERGISAIGLQYIDQFRVTGACDQFRASHLLREGSRFVPAHVFELEGLWNSHHGFFKQLAAPTAHRRLDNVNVDVVDVNNECLIQITTAHRALLDSPATDESSLLEPADGSRLHHHMVELHKANKKLLGELLNDTVCERIGLGGQQ